MIIWLLGIELIIKELNEDNRIVITLWDHTGKMQITFRYNKDDWHIEEKCPQPVQVIGYVWAYKQKKIFIGKSVVKVKDISAFCHYFELIHE